MINPVNHAKIIFFQSRITIISAILLILTVSFSVGLEQAYGANEIRQILKLEGTYPVDVSFFDVTISPSIANIDKTFVFMEFVFPDRNDNADTARSWKIIDSTTLRIFGDGQTAVGNNDVQFQAKIIEFTGASDILVQREELILTAGSVEEIKNQTIPTPINMSNTFIIGSTNYNSTDISIGSEELHEIYLKNSNTWSYFVANTPNTGNTTVRVQIVDWNDNRVSVQRGNLTFLIADTNKTTTIPTPIDKSRSFVLSTHSSNNGLEQDPRSSSFRTRILDTDEIVFFRQFTGGNDLEVKWELIELPVGSSVSHVDGNAAALTQTVSFSPTITNVTRAFPIGSGMSPAFGISSGSGSCNKAGCWEETTYTTKLLTTSTVEIERGTGTGDTEFIAQIIGMDGFFGAGALTVTLPSASNNVNVTDTVSTSLAASQTLDSTSNNVNVTDTVSTSLAASQTLDSTTNNVNVTESVTFTLLAPEPIISLNPAVMTIVSVTFTLLFAESNV